MIKIPNQYKEFWLNDFDFVRDEYPNFQDLIRYLYSNLKFRNDLFAGNENQGDTTRAQHLENGGIIIAFLEKLLSSDLSDTELLKIHNEAQLNLIDVVSDPRAYLEHILELIKKFQFQLQSGNFTPLGVTKV